MTSNDKPPRISKTRIAVGIAAIVGGLALFVYGGVDDSPGGQLLGVMIVFFGIYRSVGSRRRDRPGPK